MAKVKLNPALEQIRGQIGDLVFKRFGEEVIVGRKPDFDDRPPTPGQAAHRERFKLAALYGHTALADPVTKSLYEAKAKAEGQPVFSLIIADFFHAPVISEIDLSHYTGHANQPIRITASDDFEVVNVAVRITNTNNDVVEEGAAVHNSSNGAWTYQTTTELPADERVSIEVSATDRPGNKATKKETRP